MTPVRYVSKTADVARQQVDAPAGFMKLARSMSSKREELAAVAAARRAVAAQAAAERKLAQRAKAQRVRENMGKRIAAGEVISFDPTQLPRLADQDPR